MGALRAAKLRSTYGRLLLLVVACGRFRGALVGAFLSDRFFSACDRFSCGRVAFGAMLTIGNGQERLLALEGWDGRF